MANTMRNTVLFLCTFLIIAGGCRKKEDPKLPDNPQQERKTNLTFTFKNVVGDKPLSLNDTWYKNENGDSIKIGAYKYYVTNFALVKGDSVYEVPESYYLINEAKPESKAFTLEDLPAGEYDEVRFLIGVDAAHNTSGAQTGALDPANGMFWDWNTGYIMALMEGKSPQAAATGSTFSYHAAGFKLGTGAQRNVRLKLPKKALVAPYYYPNIIIQSDVLEWFKTPNTVSISELSVAMSDPNDIKIIADNYADMFTVEDVLIAVE